MRKTKSDRFYFWLFLAPALLSFMVVVIIPFFMGVYYSLTDWTAVAGLKSNWVGLDNYKEMFSDLALSIHL